VVVVVVVVVVGGGWHVCRDDFIILDALILGGFVQLPVFGDLTYPMWDYGGLVICLLLHMGPTEAIYYWLHRALHNHYLYTRYHSHHHALFIPEANSGTIHRHCSMPLS
jgi:aldehyde decarbonylase